MNMEEIKITDRFNFRGVLKLATQNIVIYSSFLKNYDDELILSITEGYLKEQIYKAGYKLTKEDWKIVDSYSDQDDYYPMFNFECEIIEQCTGLKDKNGKLIYEGDIVKFNLDGEEITAVVSWDGKELIGFYLNTTDYFKDKYTIDYEFYKNDYQVIGNVHETKDLLELKNDF